MPNKTGRKRRSTVRGSYNSHYDITGKAGKENSPLRSFWSNHKMEDIIQLSSEELDKVISEWITKYQAVQIKRKPTWWYPEVGVDKKKKEELDKE